MNSKLNSLIGMLFSFLAASGVQAHTGNSCGNVAIKPYVETPPIYMHEAATFRTLGKRWSTSDELKEYFEQQKTLLAQLKDQAPPEEVSAKLRMASVGDIMRVVSKQPDFVDDVLKEHLDTIDLMTGNLETLISPKYPLPPDSIFRMNSDPSVLTAFRDKNQQNYFSVLSTANNHTFDYPDDAVIDTLKTIRQEGIFQSGVRELSRDKPYLVLEKNGIRVGYYAVTTFVNSEIARKKSKLHFNEMIKGIDPIPFSAWKSGCEIDLSDTQRILKQMDQDGADIKIISIHWGIEHDMYPQPVQLDIAHQIVQQGADVIVGSHPHVPQPAEICFVNGYEETLGPELANVQKDKGCVIESSDGKSRKAMIYYSLGNFTSYSPFFWQQIGVLGEMDIVKHTKGDAEVTDWFAPNYVFTYDSVENPPHGKRHLNLLNNYIVRGCDGSKCPETTKIMVSMLNRHLYAESLTWWEELRITAITSFAAIKEIIYWQFMAPTSGAEVAGG